MIIFLLLLSLFSFADSPRKWENAKSIVERHEFYPNNEVILKPQNSWQPLFALTFLDSNFHMSKDCVYYRVPGDEPGRLKIRTISEEKDCNSEILAPGDVEIEQVTDFRFSTDSQSVSLDFRQAGKPLKWKVSTMKDWQRPAPRALLSSADFRSPRVTYLASAVTQEKEKKLTGLKDREVCHDIASDCSERSVSRCRSCDHGWREIPNGCMTGPKVCGAARCGVKDAPACRRGLIWQRKEMKPDCRTDSSFAWCAKGLQVSCDGDRAFCR